jgi:hypothetical protein
MRVEGLSQLKKFHLIGTRTRDFRACSIMPQPTMLPHAPSSTHNKTNKSHVYKYKAVRMHRLWGGRKDVRLKDAFTVTYCNYRNENVEIKIDVDMCSNADVGLNPMTTHLFFFLLFLGRGHTMETGQLQRNRNFREMSPISSMQLVSRLVSAH